jgi:uncharacterized OB-fold protein
MARHLGDDWLVPALDATNRPWFTAGRITVQSCDDCGTFQHPPDEICGGCQGSNLSFKDCSGAGTVESVAVVHHPVSPKLAEHCPYAVVVISIDGAPGANAIGNVLNRPPHEVAIGQRVRAVFEEVRDPDGGEPLLIPQWEVSDD